MVAEVVAAVQDPAGHTGVLVEPAADGQHREPGTRPLGLAEDGAGQDGVTLAVEGEGHPGPAAGAVLDLDRLPGETTGNGCRGHGPVGLVGTGAVR